MAPRTRTTPAQVSHARVAWLEAEGRAVSRDIRDARGAGSWSAVAALRRQRQSLRGELDTERLRQVEPVPAQAATHATWETFEPAFRAWLESAPMDALELAGVTWLSRLGLMISVDTSTGIPSIVRAAA